jgi:hypothetical protein
MDRSAAAAGGRLEILLDRQASGGRKRLDPLEAFVGIRHRSHVHSLRPYCPNQEERETTTTWILGWNRVIGAFRAISPCRTDVTP